MACGLIPLNKNPGVRPIGIGKVPRRIIGKSILKAVGGDIHEAAGSLQACAGHEAGCEATVHAVVSLVNLVFFNITSKDQIKCNGMNSECTISDPVVNNKFI